MPWSNSELTSSRLLWLLGLASVVTVLGSVFVGRYPAPYFMSPALLGQDAMAQQLVLLLRLPRLLTAFMLGMTLSTCGVVLQMIFRNPLIEPGFLGVSQGAAFGAAVSILWFSSSPLAVELLATFFALLGLFLSYTLAQQWKFGGWALRLILAGIAVSALFSAGVGLLKYMADPLTQLPEITFWMLGGLWSVTWREVLYILPVTVVGLTIIYLLRWRLNVLSLNDETAFSLGVAPGRERTLLLVSAVTATAAVISVSGVVGWVGLIVPHLARRLCGADARLSVPVSLVMGGLFMVVCDDLARTLLPGEIPLGILTSLIGATIFIGLMMTSSLRLRQ